MRVAGPGLEIIKDSEQLRLAAYMPTPNDVPTIGYGHTAGVKMGDTCTPAQAEQWLREDCAEAEAAVNELVKVPLNQNQFDALVSFTFNVGADIDADTIAEGLGDSTLLRKLNAGDYAGAADEFPKWCKQAGIVLGGLVKRRARERELFLTPVITVVVGPVSPPPPAPAPVPAPVPQETPNAGKPVRTPWYSGLLRALGWGRRG